MFARPDDFRAFCAEMQQLLGHRAVMMAILADGAESCEEALRCHAASERARREAAEWGALARGEKRPRVELGDTETRSGE